MIRDTSTALCCEHIAQSYGDHQVLQDINLRVAYGEILALLGRNGAGKTTLISIACGLQAPTSGKIRTAGMIPSLDTSAIFGNRIGFAPQELSIYPQLTVRQNLICMAMLHGYSKNRSRNTTDDVIDMLGLGPQREIRAELLSGGQQRRLHTAMALVHHPSVLFLDEPTVGADIEARAEIINTVRHLARNGTAVIYTTHYLEEVESLQADVAFLVDGSIVEQGSLHHIVETHAKPSIHVTFTGAEQPTINGWLQVDGHLEPRSAPSEPGHALADLLSKPATADRQLHDVEVVHANLENAYLNIVGSAQKKVQE